MRFPKFIIIFTVFIFICINNIKSQINLSFSTIENKICDNDTCFYVGPSILINEVMLTPLNGDGSVYDLDNTRRGEWIELYNPDKCKSIDISCYYLGNNAKDPTNNYGGGYRIPSNTIVPPMGFVVIRGTNAPEIPSNLLVQNGGKTIELIVDDSCNNVCLDNGANRLWFPNAGGWFAFYDKNGNPQDAISWYDMSNSCMSCNPCISEFSECNSVSSLFSYDMIAIQNKNHITNKSPQNFAGLSWKRKPDGGNWIDSASAPSMGTFNDTIYIPTFNVCNGGITVTATGGTPPYNYEWNDFNKTKESTVNELCEGRYCVTVTDAANDTSISCVNINNTALNCSISYTNASCFGESSGSAEVHVSGGTPVYSYKWSNGANTKYIQNVSAGNYNVTISDKYNCDTVQSVNISQPTGLQVTLTKNDVSKCYGDSSGWAEVNVSGGTPVYSYKWSNGSNTNFIKNVCAGIYYITVSDSLNCDTVQSISITQPSELKVNISKTDNACKYDCFGKFISEIEGGTPTYKYFFNNIASTNEVKNLCSGIYSFTVIDSNNCKNEQSVKIENLETISADFDTQIEAGSDCVKVSFFYTGKGAKSFLWNFGDNDTSININPMHIYTKSGVYLVNLIVNSGNPNYCTDTIKKSIEIKDPSRIDAPNVFTPNNDGFNDVFYISHYNVETFYCIIYNRWGGKIYEWNIIDEGWNGKNMDGYECSEGVYYYVVNATGFDKVRHNLHGTVTLFR